MSRHQYSSQIVWKGGKVSNNTRNEIKEAAN
jgi:hypothetical protein